MFELTRRALAIGLLLSLPASGAALALDAPPPCSAAEHRQFDFWVGEWEVHDAAGKLAGTNRIEKALGGCVLTENWSGAGGSRGRSFNIYDGAGKRWHQTWVDASGTLLELDGGLNDGSMVLSGDRPGRDGNPVRHRITWTPLEDGRVKQHWQVSRDGEQSWQDVFVGFYSKRE